MLLRVSQSDDEQVPSWDSPSAAWPLLAQCKSSLMTLEHTAVHRYLQSSFERTPTLMPSLNKSQQSTTSLPEGHAASPQACDAGGRCDGI